MTPDSRARGRISSSVMERSTSAFAQAPPPLSGRDSELDSLRWAWRRAVAGEGRMVTVAGESGTGKTRIAQEVAARVGTDRARVLWADCDAGAPTPYGPIVEALRSCRPALPPEVLNPPPAGTGPRLTDLLRFEERSWVGDTAGSEGVDDLAASSLARQAAREHMLENAADLFSTMSRSAPVLLIVDDMDAADQSTLVLLCHLAALAPGLRLLVIGTYCEASIDRADPLYEALHRMAANPGYEGLVLGGLDRSAVRAMVGDPARADRLWTASQGNPLCVRYLMAMKSESDEEHESALHEPHAPGVEGIVDRWLESLDDTTRHWLIAAAVVGPCFDLGVLAGAVHMRRDRAEAAMSRAAGVVEPLGTRHHYRFTHSLFRDGLYRNLTSEQRVRLHGQVAESIAEHAAPGRARQAALAFHLSQATPVGRSPQVLHLTAQLGDDAMSVGGYEDAARYYGQALAAAGPGAADAERADLLVALADAHWRSGDHLRARTAYMEAAKAARVSRDPSRLAAAALGLARIPPVWGGDGVLVTLLEDALAAIEAVASSRHSGLRQPVAQAGALRSRLAEVRNRRP